MSVELLADTSNGETTVDKKNIQKSLWYLATDEARISSLLGEITRMSKWLDHIGEEKSAEYPEIMKEYKALEKRLGTIVVDDWDTIEGQSYAPKESIGGEVLGYQLYPQVVIQPQYYTADNMRILPLETRVSYLGRELEALEALASSNEADLRGLDLALQEIVFRIRDIVIKDPEFDDSTLLTHSKGGRNAMLLYLAIEHAYAGDFATTENIIEDMHDMSAIKQFLGHQLGQAQESASSNRMVPDQTSRERLRRFIGEDYEKWEQIAENTEFDLTIGVQPDVALKIFGEPIGGRLLTATEFSVSGGRTINKTWDRSLDYNHRRNIIDAESLRYPGNIFLPKLVYGALNTDRRLDKGNGYGSVVMHLREREDASFTIGDSMPSGRVYADTTERCVNEHEAKIAAVYNEAQGQKNPDTGKTWYSTGVAYVEAQLPGATFEDIDYVSLSHFDSSFDGTIDVEQMKSVANAVMDHGIPVSLDFFHDPRVAYQYIDMDDRTRTITEQIRDFLDPTGERREMISVRLIEPVPTRQGESLEDCIKRYRDKHGMVVISGGVEQDGQLVDDEQKAA